MTDAKRFPFDPGEFEGKRVLVTGGTKGMGEAIVRRLAAGGATVATTARSPLPEGQAPHLFVQADISTPEGVTRVIGEVMAALAWLPSAASTCSSTMSADPPRRAAASWRSRMRI